MFSLDKFVQGANSLGGSIGGQAGGAIKSVAGIAQGIGNIGKIFSRTGLPKGGETKGAKAATASFGNVGQKDWRVSLSIPTGQFFASTLIKPLVESGDKFIFPFTPQITLSHSASYSAMDPIHNNYSFSSYENSKIDKITITGDFYCENSNDAAYWIAAVHFFRSVTKMHFGGNTENAGAPPPVLKLNGYGDFVFNNVPVVVTAFQVDMPKDVDYIPSKFLGTKVIEGENIAADGVGYVPVRSTFNVTVIPMYSREAVRNFNLQDFVNGDYVFDKGFI